MNKQNFQELFNIFKYPLLLLILYLAAYPLYEYWWTDIVAHFLGGLAIAISWQYAFKYTGLTNVFKKMPNYWQFLMIIGLTTIVGILWEIFELILDKIIGFEEFKSWRIDTMMDLIMGATGGAAGFWLNKNK